MKESELFEPVKAFFTDDGYSGDGEVGGIDIYLEKDGLSTAVELKKTLDFRSVQQAALDQKICDFVYIAIVKPKNLYSAAGKDKIYLLKRLGIGLLCVSPRTKTVEVVTDPVVSEISNFQKNHGSRTASIKAEFKKRKIRANTGGVNRTGLMTSYREDTLLVLLALDTLGGQARTKQIREMTNIPKSTKILYDNYYGWFENVSKGEYEITDAGRKALEQYADTVKKLAASLRRDL